jgi:2-keto-3-deoxy-L-rhamnonate aldolase RhmA
VVVQIEHRDAISSVDQIAAVPGIDALFVGPYDLSNSMGLVGQVSHPEVVAAIDKVRAVCARTSLAMGIYCSNADQARNEIKAGARMVAVGTDIMHMANSARSTLEALRAV